MTTRTCNKCGHTGPLETDFPKNQAYAGGHRPQCKSCHNGAARQWQKDNPQKFAVIQNTYRENNGTEIRKKQREKFQNNPPANEKKNAMTRAWRERMKAEGKMEDIKRRYRLVKYELSPRQYDEMFAAQRGVCAICARPEKEAGKPLAVDHNHSTGENRELLCGLCNKALGLFQDNPDLLIKAAIYIRKHEKHEPMILERAA